jgi:hypothetical protein
MTQKQAQASQQGWMQVKPSLLLRRRMQLQMSNVTKNKTAIGKGLLDKNSGLTLALGCFVIVLVCLAVGLRLDAKSVIVNLTAGLVCTVVSIPIAIWIIDRYLKYTARRQWSRVDTLTYRATATHLCDSAVEILIGMDVLDDLRPMENIQAGRDKPDPKAIEGVSALSNLLRAVPNPANNDIYDKAIECYKACKWDLDQLCDSLLPRIIEYSDEQDLIDSLILLDGFRRTLHHSMIGNELAGTGGVFYHLPELVAAVAQVYGTLLSHWNPVS